VTQLATEGDRVDNRSDALARGFGAKECASN
jgi:hypothetical protein